MLKSIEVEDFYDYSYTPLRRYGDGRPAHLLLEGLIKNNYYRYESLALSFASFIPDFQEIPLELDLQNPQFPYWNNNFYPAFDAISLFGLIASLKPNLYLEIGSGNSTRFAWLAKQKYSPETKIVAIDPVPRAEIETACNTIINSPLQDCDLSIFQRLQPGDFLIFDGSHRLLQNSDVEVFFLEVLPRIKPGVLVHIHDIFWPWDYPTPWAKRLYSEQYMLGLMLLTNPTAYEIILPNTYVSWDTPLLKFYDELWNYPGLAGIDIHGAAFWFTKNLRP